MKPSFKPIKNQVVVITGMIYIKRVSELYNKEHRVVSED